MYYKLMSYKNGTILKAEMDRGGRRGQRHEAKGFRGDWLDGEHLVHVLLKEKDSSFSSTKTLDIETLLGNVGLAHGDDMNNVSVRMTRIVMEED
jgi:hypothetical protein